MPRKKPRPAKTEAKKVPWKRILVAVVVAVVGVGGAKLLHVYFRPKPQTLQAAIVKQFGGQEGVVVANVPSRRDRYPGAVLAVSPQGSELLVRAAARPDEIPATSGSLKGVELVGEHAAWELAGRTYGSALSGQGSAMVTLELTDIRIFEVEASALAEALRADDSVSRARASGQPVVVVTKAYEAIPTVTVKQGSLTTSEAWTDLKGVLTKASGTVTADDAVELRSTTPQVVAYETCEVTFVADSFSSGDVTIGVGAPRQAWTVSHLPRQADFDAESSSGLTYAVVASPTYRSGSFGDLPAASWSANLVSDLFESAGGEQVPTGLEVSERLTEAGLMAAVQGLVGKVKEMDTKPKALVFYYAGHAVSGTSGAYYLVMGDYTGKISEDLVESSPLGLSQDPTQPLSGSNAGDLAAIVAAVERESASSIPGLVPVERLYEELSKAGIRFAIVLDGCYAADAMDSLRDSLQFTDWGDFYGDEGQMIENMREYQRALRAYGNVPYLQSENPVIFAARPGTLASVVQHPIYEGEFSPGVGPLAAKLTNTYLYALELQDNLTLQSWLIRITDFSGTGELDVEGSISWSNFDALNSVPIATFD